MSEPASVQERASNLIERSALWDNHACMPLRIGDTEKLPELEMHRQAGFAAVTLNVAMDMIPWQETFKVLAGMRRWIHDHSDRYVLGTDVESIRLAKESGRLAVFFDIEGAGAVDDMPELVDVYYALGVRWMLIAYNRRNRVGSGCQVEDEGLTAFGRRLIDEMERAGMILCCSHAGARTAAEAIEYSRNPVIFSHSNPRAVENHYRNISDELIRVCAAKGGVIGLVGFGPMVGAAETVTPDRLADHADYVGALVGPEHIGLGLDYVFDPTELGEFIVKYPGWFPGLSEMPAMPPMIGPHDIHAFVELLLKRGWKEQDLRGVLGENLMRVAQQVWR